MTAIEQVQIRDLNQKIDGLLEVTTRIDERTKSQEKCKEDHEERIRALESNPGKQWSMVKTIVVTAILTTIVTGGLNFLATFLR